MLDQLYGRPSTSWKRSQVFVVLLFWVSRIARGNPRGPPVPLLRRLNRYLASFTPYKIILSTLTLLYAIKNSDAILGLQAPEPLARLYNRDYYRATWIVTALDCGFASAMTVKPKWLRDILSVGFAGYYLLFASEADEKLRKYRAVCTVEMLRATWEKTTNPIIRFATRGDRPNITIRKKILLPRPKGSSYTKPITAWLFYNGSEAELKEEQDLIFDLPGGGFICMSPEHHEERLLRWAIRTEKPVLSFDYGKAPEYPYPFAIDEAYDAYKLLHDTKGKCIGMSGIGMNIVMSGDSAGANIATAVVIKILETRPRLPIPVSLVYAYAALSFHFTSWMPASDLKVLRQDSSADVQGLLRGKDHLDHKSPLSVVEDEETDTKRRGRKRDVAREWGRRLSGSGTTNGKTSSSSREKGKGKEKEEKTKQYGADQVSDYERPALGSEGRKPLSERVLAWTASANDLRQKELQVVKDEVGKKVEAKMIGQGPLETRLAMTSRTAFFNDRIISPPMARAMALLYIGPRNAPDLHSDYHISPIFTPAHLLHQFPPIYLSCGERDPFVDDTVIFAGKLREAKETRKLELLARENKFGESLRMTGSASTRDPLLDEGEDDWIQMKIIEGWSHGYLQMLSLLPEALTAINMMSDWISDSFEKHHAKFPVAKDSTPKLRLQPATPVVVTSSLPPITPPLSPVPAQRSFSSVNHPRPAPSFNSAFDVPELTSESDRDDEVLMITPRKRNGSSASSRTGSPAPPSISGTPPRATGIVKMPLGRPIRSLSSEEDTTGSSSNTLSTNASSIMNTSAGIKFSTPPTHPSILSLPSPSFPQDFPPRADARLRSPSLTQPRSSSLFHHERPLRDDLLTSTLKNSLPGTHLPLHLDPVGIASASESDLSTPVTIANAQIREGRPTAVKMGRSGSTGSLPANFVDARDLMRRRRVEAVAGISSNGGSTVGSSDEDDSGKIAAGGGNVRG